MENFTLLLIWSTLIVPIFLPLFFWYFLKNKDSIIYLICRIIRRIWSVLILVSIGFKAYQFPHQAVTNIFEVIGGLFSQLILVYLLWKVWKKQEKRNDADKAEASF